SENGKSHHKKDCFSDEPSLESDDQSRNFDPLDGSIQQIGVNGDDSHNTNPNARENSQMKVKPHHCTLCNKTFSKASVLTIHLRVHSGERPYRCDQCGA